MPWVWVDKRALARLEDKLDLVIDITAELLGWALEDAEQEEEVLEMATQLSEAVERLRGSVEAETTEVASAVTAINGFGQLIRDLQAQVAEAADVPAAVAAIEAFRAELDKTPLAEAVAANTPSAPTA